MEYLQYGVKMSYKVIVTEVLNLVISGIPSIRTPANFNKLLALGFKPCYKWNTFNTLQLLLNLKMEQESFKPCYKWNTFNTLIKMFLMLVLLMSFKPCYKWNTFNTEKFRCSGRDCPSFKPCYKWNTFNTQNRKRT